MTEKFKPKIVCFICDWCSIHSADLIGVAKSYFHGEIASIRIPCIGRINPEMIGESFLNLADGVLILGCEKGNCNYLTGNYQAERVVKACKEVLKIISVSTKRLELHLESDIEISKVHSGFYEKIKSLGPLFPDNQKERKELIRLLTVARNTLLNEDLKWLVAREWTLVSQENVFGEFLSQEEFDTVLLKRIKEQFVESYISQLIAKKHFSVAEISRESKIEKKLIFEAIVEMKKRGLVKEVDIVERIPRYIRA